MKLLLVPLFLLAACATAKKTAPLTEVAPPAKTAAAPAAQNTSADDFEALLKGLAIHFDFDRADITADSQKRLDMLAEKMRQDPKVHIKVAGNADELGTEEYNLALGQKRADAVKVYLGRLGIEQARVETVSFGEEKPLDDAHTPEAWSKNRRDDIQKK